jgi:pimeloyl-ACP methyl ester carboxylesterase
LTGVFSWLKRLFHKSAPSFSMRTGRAPVGADGELAYAEWGDPAATDIVLCVHGLTRNAHDFDVLAAALSANRRVIALDVIGRGGSSWLAKPERYGYPLYFEHALAFMDALKLESVDWIGTSMGGIIGMMVAAQQPQRVRRLVLNDIGALVPKQALTRILSYVGKEPSFATMAEAEAYFRTTLAPFGQLDDATWARLAVTSTRQLPDGRLTTGYDPAIAVALAGADAQDISLWPLWTMVTQPVLLLRGADSDLLSQSTADAMTARGRVELVEFPGAGHAPSLMAPEQIAVVRRWLDAA